MAITLDVLQAAYANYSRLLLLCTTVISEPTAVNVDAVVSGATAAGLLTPKLDYGADGVSYNWTAYQTFIIQQMKVLKELIALEAAPWDIRSSGY